MASRIRNPFKHEPQHRAAVKKPRTAAYPSQARPRHCAGQGTTDGCLSHLHPGEPEVPMWRTGPAAGRTA